MAKRAKSEKLKKIWQRWTIVWIFESGKKPGRRGRRLVGLGSRVEAPLGPGTWWDSEAGKVLKAPGDSG